MAQVTSNVGGVRFVWVKTIEVVGCYIVGQSLGVGHDDDK